jgi:hypothetical protein
MKFKTVIKMDNDAFIVDPAELSRILKKLAEYLETLEITSGTIAAGSLFDINGNKVGNWEVI